MIFPEEGNFSVIMADPPWTFATYSGRGREKCADRHYECMTLEDIKTLPVGRCAARDCVLLLWVTDPFLRTGFQVIEAWGFTYKTVGFYWTKLNKDGTPFMGNGYWTRGNPEQCLLATCGTPKRSSANVRKWISSPRREHSRKPEEFRDRVEALLDGPYLELFSREPRVGWTTWGHERDKFTSSP